MTRPEIALTLDNDDASAGVPPGPQSAPPSAAVPSATSTSNWAVMDVAYTEFLRHQEKGEPFDLDAFCAGFPDCRSSLLRLLKTHQFIDDNPAYLQGRPDTSWPNVGERHGDLTLLRELGRGSFSRVFLATESSTGDRLVAVKFSRRGDAEARTQGRLSHPHVVPILSARRDEAAGLTVVVMPYLGSATLEDVLDRAWPPPGPEGTRAIQPRKAEVIAGVLRACARPEDP